MIPTEGETEPAPDAPDAPAEDARVDLEMRTSDAYAIAALVCSLLFFIPIVPAAAALLLVRATKPPMATSPLTDGGENAARVATIIAWTSILLWVGFTVVLLFGILVRVLQ